MKKLTLTDILVTVTIAFGFGVIYKLWGPLYYSVKPLGIHLDQLIYGMWFIAAIVAFAIVKKAGVAFLAELAASSGELIMGSEFGLEVLLYGALQGVGAELAFALFKYKSESVMVMALAGLFSGVASLLLDFFKGYIGELELWNLLLFIGLRLMGSIVLAGILGYAIARGIESTGVTASLHGGTKEDYDALER
ncbi:thiamine ABC transporter permease [Bacillus coahuilensis p1.1.43]|uniref:Thiamine ABC transporter permease n=1 Tax=Bacillus coahuilensis p1.1.43 TaxID=1150625 RepID=A0A147KA04_9BACI|nr:ECF transporter S component [Bacillus coahuilensis]KUP07193.1 thiamine ABC transporter permease [Bacillus coahuilensis p1.1.43]